MSTPPDLSIRNRCYDHAVLRKLAARSLNLFPSLNRRVLASLAEREVGAAFADPATPPVLVYQMGKVGSSSVYEGLKAAGLVRRSLHVHFLSDDLADHIANQVNAGIDPPPYHFHVSGVVHRHLATTPRPRCKVISLVRDPVAFEISNLFENPHIGGDRARQDPSAFLEEELSKAGAFSYVNDWFDRELKAVFGVDVFGRPFPHAAGYDTYQSEHADVLLIRLEDLSRCGHGAIAEFLGLPTPLPLPRANSRGKSRRYSRARDSITLDQETCDRIYSERLPFHFYSADERAAFSTRWTNRAP